METKSNYFFSNLKGKSQNNLIKSLNEYAENNKCEIYCLSAPLMDEKYSYEYSDGWSILIPGFPIFFIKERGDSQRFYDYVDDYLDDLSHIADKFNFLEHLGRRRTWNQYYVTFEHEPDINEMLNAGAFKNNTQKRVADIMISLIIGCYNDASKIDVTHDDNLLDIIKNKILLFDCKQIKFLYTDPPENEKLVFIQGLAGTGKTELLLHKLKNLYLKEDNAVLGFTCYNKVLASVLRQRIPEFFDKMSAHRQIDWDNKLLCTHAWGNWHDSRSGILSYICAYYSLPWYNLREVGNFDIACRRTMENLMSNRNNGTSLDFCFTYMFIDESQDFPSSFIELCEAVTQKRVYVAGDIFQNIFTIHDSKLLKQKKHIVLNQCYRTDPRTFMFAHAMGMGLLEKNKINWLTDEDWEKCGYIVDKIEGNTKYRFRRLPIRRFEDLPEDYEPMRIYKSANPMGGIVREIDEWKEKFPSLTVDDIGIIFIDTEQKIYQTAPTIASYIKRRYGWECNLAYDTKKRIPGKVFISNKNNVKGLEFPFVFCITSGIKNDLVYRHTLYTMLSRSHLRTVLIFDDNNADLKESVQKGIAEIMSYGSMTVDVPDEQTMETIKLNIATEIKHKSLEERLNLIFNSEEIPHSDRLKIQQALLNLDLTLETLTDSKLKDIILQTWQVIDMARH